jgi:tRNA modification GTPase
MPEPSTIFALSSGLPPAGIALVRISGPRALAALAQMIGHLPAPRRAVAARICDPATGSVIDHGLVISFPGPRTVTGDDIAELHLHGGRAVIAAALSALGGIEGLRQATAGEFTRRAFENGRIDLAEAEGLADLLAAETEGQRQSALALSEGELGGLVAQWQKAILNVSAQIEAALDFSDEDDVGDDLGRPVRVGIGDVARAIGAMLDLPPAERLRDGVRVVLGGPPNAGKSSLFNRLVGRSAAIVTDIAGTTRDRIEAPVTLGGIPFVMIDTAGLHDGASDAVEAIGIARASEALAGADIILWLGRPEAAPAGALLIAAKADIVSPGGGLPVSAVTGVGIDALSREIIRRGSALLPKPGSLALNARHRAILGEVLACLEAAIQSADMLITAEHVRCARNSLDAITGRSGVEDMLDALFGAFCIGK